MLYKLGSVIFLILIVGLQFLILKSLDYSTSLINWINSGDVSSSLESKDRFKVGNFEWDVKLYRKSPEMEPFRRYFQANCEGLKGVKSASCLSKKFIKIIPFGSPSSEIFNAKYSPVLRLEDSLRGEPGHCVTYSTMTVNTLLSVGIPARFAQVIINDIGGHNIIEVWDDEKGWVFFDPLNNGVLVKDGKYLSAIEAISTNEKIELLDADTNLPAQGYLADSYRTKSNKLLKAYVIYPEPWLYTRVGKKDSEFYRGSFVAVGEKDFMIGPLQDLLRIGIVISSLILVIISLYFAKQYLAKSQKKRLQKQYFELNVTES